MFKNLYQKFRMGIIVGTSWGVLMIIGYEITKLVT